MKIKIYRTKNSGYLFLGSYQYGGEIEGIIICNKSSSEQFKLFRLSSMSVRPLKEENNFNFSSSDLSGAKKFVTSIPELKLLFFYNPSLMRGSRKDVLKLNMNNGKFSHIPLEKFHEYAENSNMSKKVTLSLEEKKKKKLKDSKKNKNKLNLRFLEDEDGFLGWS